MANRSRPTQLKHQRERALAERRRDKAARRVEAKAQRANVPRRPGEEDPDIAGIRPGPQPVPEEFREEPAPPAGSGSRPTS